MGFGGFALLGKEEPIYISDWRTPQLLSTDVTLHCNYMGCFVRRCTAVNLTLFFTSKGSLALDAGMLHVKTHLDDVINGNNSHPYALQSSTGRAECRGCRCEFLRLVLRRGLLHFAWIWYSHGNRRSNLAPISCPTGFGAWTPPPRTGREYRTIIEEKKKGRQIWWTDGELKQYWPHSEHVQLFNIWKLSCGCGLTSRGAESLLLYAHWLDTLHCPRMCLSVCLLSVSVSQEQMWGGQTAVKGKQTERKSVLLQRHFHKDSKFKRLGGNSKSTARRRQ